MCVCLQQSDVATGQLRARDGAAECEGAVSQLVLQDLLHPRDAAPSVRGGLRSQVLPVPHPRRVQGRPRTHHQDDPRY